ncbi:hypothetical protein L596_004224 [Steinernema carpocapsae]|uniref:Uncharacterized protein n=1 Tax=Steinernema carpocapsae TaxID=34508 RepID=A0A4U8UV19_STECR|nr:hypothetical protein L596_004224 [Steinernema carpocapsae]
MILGATVFLEKRNNQMEVIDKTKFVGNFFSMSSKIVVLTHLSDRKLLEASKHLPVCVFRSFSCATLVPLARVNWTLCKQYCGRSEVQDRRLVDSTDKRLGNKTVLCLRECKAKLFARGGTAENSKKSGDHKSQLMLSADSERLLSVSDGAKDRSACEQDCRRIRNPPIFTVDPRKSG